MEERSTEPVELDRVRRDAACVIIRIGLGGYQLAGPAENVLIPESHVAWATVAHELEGEGYRLVSPEEYAETTGTPLGEVIDGIEQAGSLFAVRYRNSVLVPLPQKEAILPDIDVPGH